MGETLSLSSPCINVCVINAETGHCFGCFRTMDEIADWQGYPASQKAAVLAELERRRAVADPAD